VLSPRVPCSRKMRFQLSSSWAGTWLSRDTASSASPRKSRKTNSDFRWTLHRSGSSTSFGGLDGSGDVAGFLGFVPMSGLLGHGHPSQLRVPRNRVRFKLDAEGFHGFGGSRHALSQSLVRIQAGCHVFHRLLLFLCDAGSLPAGPRRLQLTL